MYYVHNNYLQTIYDIMQYKNLLSVECDKVTSRVNKTIPIRQN